MWLYSEESGDPDSVGDFAPRCAEAFGPTGLWGFVYGLSCSKARLDGFGGGEQLLDLGRREHLAWMDCQDRLERRLAAAEARPVAADALLRQAAAGQGWTPATQGGVLLDFIDALIADGPAVADRLRAHLDAIVADARAAEVDLGPVDDGAAGPEETACRGCGEPMWASIEGTSHRRGAGMDDADHARDRDHTAVADEGG